ncbi:transcription factor bHLH95 [Ziziphus jujuba]|uniref:Transcription factor bHLH95 n=1 Tax=Ziziphus jujuba TaxID=326968 RepID=A0A6P3ZVE4_ZIZJJ|nr:transcription factor bHLH95 [Ziziphus jujuba]
MSSLELEDNPFWAGVNSGSSSGASEEKLGMMNHPHVSSSSSPTATTTSTTIHQKMKSSFKNQKADGGGGGGGELHIWTERERRKKMRDMFSVLHSLLPQLAPKADKSTIVDEAVKYIKTLEQTLQTLQEQKANKILMNEHGAPSMPKSQTAHEALTQPGESILGDHHHQVGGPISQADNLFAPNSSSSSFRTWFSPNVVVNMCGDSAQISVCSPRKPGLSATIFYILEKHKLHVLSAHISSYHHRCMYMIHAHAGGAADHFPEALSVEDIFKLAAGEMNLWLLSC